MGYREDYLNRYKGKVKLGHIQRVYRCKSCRKYFPKSQIEIDHVIPKRKGGTDDLWNLQPMCLKCNRGKGCKQNKFDTICVFIKATLHLHLFRLVFSILSRKLKDLLGIKYKR